MATTYSGNRSTAQAVDSVGGTLVVRQIDDQLALLEPNETPLVTLLLKMKKRFPVYNTEYQWLEDDFGARWASVNDGGAGGGGRGAIGDSTSTMTVDDGNKFVAGDMFCIPNAVSSSVAPEVCRVTLVATNDITFTRGVGSTTKVAIANGAAFRILGNAYEEGATPPSAKTTVPVLNKSYTQIFKTTIDLTKTQAAIKQYGSANGERKKEQKKKLAEHKQKMNAAALWGAAAAVTGPGGKPLRTTMGLNSAISTNVTDAGGNLTKKTFETFARNSFRYGKNQKLLIASPMVISAIHDWGNSFLLVSPGEKLLGVDIERVQTGHGVFLLCRDWMLEDGVAGKNGFGGMAFCVDMDECSYFFLDNNGENRDTKLVENVIKDGRDAYVDEILTEGGFAFKHERKHSKLYNVTDYTV